MSKKLLIPGIASLLLIPSVLAQLDLSPLTNALDTFARFIFINLKETLGAVVFIKVMLGLIIFTVFYAVLMNMGEKSPFKKKNFAIPISAALALLSVVFIPDEILFSIAFSYGGVVSFLLMAIPVVAVIYLVYKVFPTGTTSGTGATKRDVDIGERRVNHGIKAVVYYFLSTVVNNYMVSMKVVTTKGTSSLANAPFPTGWIDMGGLVIAACMLLFIYHLALAIFASGKYEYGENEGWFEGLGKVLGRGEREGEPLRREEEERRGEGAPDFTPVYEEISGLNQEVEGFYTGAADLLRLAPQVRDAPADQVEAKINDFLKKSAELRAIGAEIDARANALADMRHFPDLAREHTVRLGEIVRRYETALEMLIDAINIATR